MKQTKNKESSFELCANWKTALDLAITEGNVKTAESLLMDQQPGASLDAIIFSKLLKSIKIYLSDNSKVDQFPIITLLIEKINHPGLIDAMRVKFFFRQFGYHQEQLDKLETLFQQKYDALTNDKTVNQISFASICKQGLFATSENSLKTKPDEKLDNFSDSPLNISKNYSETPTVF